MPASTSVLAGAPSRNCGGNGPAFSCIQPIAAKRRKDDERSFPADAKRWRGAGRCGLAIGRLGSINDSLVALARGSLVRVIHAFEWRPVPVRVAHLKSVTCRASLPRHAPQPRGCPKSASASARGWCHAGMPEECRGEGARAQITAPMPDCSDWKVRGREKKPRPPDPEGGEVSNRAKAGALPEPSAEMVHADAGFTGEFDQAQVALKMAAHKFDHSGKPPVGDRRGQPRIVGDMAPLCLTRKKVRHEPVRRPGRVQIRLAGTVGGEQRGHLSRDRLISKHERRQPHTADRLTDATIFIGGGKKQGVRQVNMDGTERLAW